MMQGNPMQTPQDPVVGKGESADAPRLWMRAIREGWQIPDLARRAAIGRAAQILADPQSTRREVSRATQTLVIIERLGLDAAREEDRISRLDAGTATDRVELTQGISDAQLAAVARLYPPQPVALPEALQPPRKPCRKPRRKRKG